MVDTAKVFACDHRCHNPICPAPTTARLLSEDPERRDSKAHQETPRVPGSRRDERAQEVDTVSLGMHIGTHTLRHSYARHYMPNGVPINHLSPPQWSIIAPPLALDASSFWKSLMGGFYSSYSSSLSSNSSAYASSVLSLKSICQRSFAHISSIARRSSIDFRVQSSHLASSSSSSSSDFE